MSTAQLTLPRPVTWADHAACLREDPELFFPAAFTEAFAEQIGKAKAVCRTCPVRTDCLDYTLSKPQHGIWGGTTDDERRRIRAGHPIPDPEPTGGPVTVHALNPKPAEQTADKTTDQDTEPVGIVGLEQLLHRAEQSENAATRKAGEKIREAVEDLRQRVNAEVAEARVRAEISELEKQLAAKQEKLRELRPAKKGARGGSYLPDGAEAKGVRAWAKERGVTCPAHGRIPQSVVDQYLAAIQ